MKVEISDLSMYSKNYTVRPGITADDKAVLERPKPHDIFIQDVKNSQANIFD
tara:strand:+ start:422 stop:577 length:156 start_codon:yes stop_codon:yes gene_type:complete